MNYQNYDEYMRCLMGCQNMYSPMTQSMSQPMMFQHSNMDASADELERMYPEVYRVVYPMVCFACDNIRTPVNEQMIDMMTDDIYDRVEADGRINIELSVEVRDSKLSIEETKENRQRPRPRRRNRFLRDLIRILLLRELLGRRQRFPFRPF